MSYSPVSYNPQSTGSSEAVISNYTNASSVTAIPQGMGVSCNSSGLVVPLDVSNETNVKALVGAANVRIPASSSGPVISEGRLQTITTAFSVGNALYFDTSGNPTNIYPTIGSNGFVSGDWIVFLGVLVPNVANPSETDIQLFIQVIGQL